jgi:hypothetical protein
MTGELLLKQIEKDVANEFYPAFVAVALWSDCAFDDFKSIVEVLEAHFPDVWVHACFLIFETKKSLTEFFLRTQLREIFQITI